MSTKHIISPGIGFSPGSVKYIVTRGLIGQSVPNNIGSDNVSFARWRDMRTLAEFDDKRTRVRFDDKRTVTNG